MKGNAYVPFMLRRGDGSTLSLDFTAMGDTLDSRFTFTRSSTTSTYINSSGLVATAGTNVPRFDYDPTTLTARGLLIEGAATNLFFYSNPIATTGSYWGSGGYTLGTGATSPDGTNTSTRFTVNSNSGATCSMQQSVTINATSCTFSIWFKNGTLTGSSNVALTSVAVRNATTATILLRFYFNATNPSSITYVTGSTGASVVAYANGWYRISATVTSGVTSGNTITGYFAGLGSGINGELNNYADWWGPQMEQGTAASSFIPTVASQVARTRDEMTMANISALNFNQSGGTVLMQVEGNPRDQGSFPHFAGFEQSPSGRGWNFLRLNNTSAGLLRMLGTAWNTAGGTLINSANHTRPAGRFKFATTLEPSVSRMTYVINGGSALVDTSTAGTLATIGSLRFNNTTDTAATDFGSVWVSHFKYWPSVLPNATLQSLTT
jgi:hypothetical protein